MDFLKRSGLLLVILALVLGCLAGCQTQLPQTDVPATTQKVEIPTSDPYVGVTAEEFYANYTPANNYMDAYYRSQHGFLSGSLEVPGQDAVPADNRPMEGGKYVRNTASRYADDGKTYIVVDSSGKECAEYNPYKCLQSAEIASAPCQLTLFFSDTSLPNFHTDFRSAQSASHEE